MAALASLSLTSIKNEATGIVNVLVNIICKKVSDDNKGMVIVNGKKIIK